MKLIRYLFHRPTWQRLHMIPRQYATEYTARDVDRDTATLMQLTQVRSPQNVEILKRKHRASSARHLIEILPSRRRPRHIQQRALALVRRVFGLTSYDPMRKIARQHMRRGRR
jgi:hypothetical protein